MSFTDVHEGYSSCMGMKNVKNQYYSKSNMKMDDMQEC